MVLAIRKNTKPTSVSNGGTNQGRRGEEAFRTGLTLILADAARSHLEAGNLDKATLCLEEAQRCLDLLSSP